MFEKGFVSGEILSESFHFLKRPVSYKFTVLRAITMFLSTNYQEWVFVTRFISVTVVIPLLGPVALIVTVYSHRVIITHIE